MSASTRCSPGGGARASLRSPLTSWGTRHTTRRPARGALFRSRSDAAPRAIAFWRRMYSAP
eukprot:6359794-Prymnesium_polylepis.1